MASLLKLTNNALGRLNASITTLSTTIQLVPGQGAKFPSLAAGEFFPCHLVAADGTIEIVKVTARSGDNLTVLRGQEGTAASAFAINDRCELRLTGGALQGELDRIVAVADSYVGAIAAANAAAAAALPKTGGEMSGPLVLSNAVPIRLENSGGVAHDFAYVSTDNFTNLFDAGGGGFRLWDQAGSVILFGVEPNGTVAVKNHIVFPQSTGVFVRDPGGNARQLVKMDGADVNFTVAGGSNINYFNQAGTTIVASLNNAGDYVCKTLTTTSDENKKTNWQAIPDAVLDRLADMVLAGFFDWIDGSGASLGGSAQELRRIGLGVAVAEDADGNLSVNYGGLTFAIVQAMLRREKVRSAAVEHRLAALEAK